MIERTVSNPAEAAIAQLALAYVVDRQVLAMQAAWIEWKHGEGADVAMSWIENTLEGPDLIPQPENGTDAQAFFDRKSDESYRRQREGEDTIRRELGGPPA